MNIYNEFLQFHGNFLFGIYSNIIPFHSMFSYTAKKPVIKAIMNKSSIYIIRNEREFFHILSRYVKHHYSDKSQLPNFETEATEVLLIIYMEEENYKICLINFAANRNKEIPKYTYSIPIIKAGGKDISFGYITNYKITSLMIEKENYTPVFTLIPRITPPLLFNTNNVQPICFAENTSLMIGYVNSTSNIRYFFTELVIMDFYTEKQPIILDRCSKLSHFIVNKHFPEHPKLPTPLSSFSLGKSYTIHFLESKTFVVTHAEYNTTQLENCIRYGYMGIPLHILSLS